LDCGINAGSIHRRARTFACASLPSEDNVVDVEEDFYFCVSLRPSELIRNNCGLAHRLRVLFYFLLTFYDLIFFIINID